ncbi:glycosyltransferase family 2 protein [Citrobacter portucalensis]|uniref:glycosyltransferase family 2 protein n=1 Tax=Citrobacter portucalensis TaxID=1639133 RepID=UPI001C6FED46|nr:glycosyltransferase family 2 protein [Citrobacter portucalensis]MBW9452860.1 glycosyltransferase family 2 protein [Citrobacter portucalensis]MBW9456825.1 glycosyltransferase family 2 protein [Citrobacter portucalensis]
MNKISLVLCTLNNFDEIKKFTSSLLKSEVSEIELIVIDQNSESILYLFSNISRCDFVDLKYFHVNFKGLSRARNFALKHVTGNIVCFPDDDCVYSPRLLSNVQKIFNDDSIDFISVNTIDPIDSQKSLIKLPTEGHLINYQKKSCVSFTLFFRSNVIDSVGEFDEKMGVGSGTKYGSGEESDYVVRVISNGFVGKFFPELYVYHPAKESLSVFDRALKNRMLSYGGGYGYFLRKNFKLQGYLLSFRNLLGIIARLFFSLKSKNEFYKALYFLLGFIQGFLKR